MYHGNKNATPRPLRCQFGTDLGTVKQQGDAAWPHRKAAAPERQTIEPEADRGSPQPQMS